MASDTHRYVYDKSLTRTGERNDLLSFIHYRPTSVPEKSNGTLFARGYWEMV